MDKYTALLQEYRKILGQVISFEEVLQLLKNELKDLQKKAKLEVEQADRKDKKRIQAKYDEMIAAKNDEIIVAKSKDNMCGDEHKVFELVWRDDKWCEYVEYAFKILIDDNRFFYINEFAGLLFAKTTDATILERKKYYLLEKLRENNSEIEKCKKLIDVVVNILPEWKLEYILEFLKVNKKLEDFKKIDLFPSFCSWSGNEIPLIRK